MKCNESVNIVRCAVILPTHMKSKKKSLWTVENLKAIIAFKIFIDLCFSWHFLFAWFQAAESVAVNASCDFLFLFTFFGFVVYVREWIYTRIEWYRMKTALDVLAHQNSSSEKWNNILLLDQYETWDICNKTKLSCFVGRAYVE